MLILSRISLVIPCYFFPVFVNKNDITLIKRAHTDFY